MSIDAKALEALVRAAVEQVAVELQNAKPTARTVNQDADCDDVCAPLARKPQPLHDVVEARAIVDATPARLVQGRTGTRYLTDTYVQLRAEHAVALDAVHAQVPDGWAAQHGLVALQSRCKSHAEYLLQPDLGRRLDDDSRARLLREATPGVDVQVIAGDGLSAHALLQQGPALLPALDAALRSQGFSTGKPLFVKHARIGVQDEIGVLLNCKSTVILVGERPGLGTGDSLSIYTAYRPRLQQDNAEKNCISNIRGLGLPPLEAAVECARLMRRSFDAGGGGVRLVQPMRDIAKRQSW
jgi:ethanolamine ammonia-lyase small subunit